MTSPRVMPDERLALVHARLAELAESALFLGPATRHLLLPATAPLEATVTEPVRLTWDVSTDFGYAALLGRLEQLGFRRKNLAAPLPERSIEGVAVRVEPPVPTLLGFTSQWHQSALASPRAVETATGPLRFANLAHFAALELEALLPLDEEAARERVRDLLPIFAEGQRLIEEMRQAPAGLRDFVTRQSARWAATPDFSRLLRQTLSPGAQLSEAWARAQETLRLLEQEAPPLTTSPPPPEVTEDAPVVPLAGDGVWRPPSGAIAAVAYDARQELLTVEFRRGAVYTYLAVPPLVFGAWKNSASPGHYHNDWIRDRYEFRRVL